MNKTATEFDRTLTPDEATQRVHDLIATIRRMVEAQTDSLPPSVRAMLGELALAYSFAFFVGQNMLEEDGELTSEALVDRLVRITPWPAAAHAAMQMLQKLEEKGARS